MCVYVNMRIFVWMMHLPRLEFIEFSFIQKILYVSSTRVPVKQNCFLTFDFNQPSILQNKTTPCKQYCLKGRNN